MEDMAVDFGWSLDDWDEEPLTQEELDAERRSMEQESKDSVLGELYASQWSFD